MAQIDLMRALPKTKRNIQKRHEVKDPSVIAIAKQYGEMYWDGPRDYGYGGYNYDGRWRPVARDIIKHYKLEKGMRVLDIGCGKGFLVKDLMLECPGLEVFGLDISLYAVTHSPKELIGRLHLGSAEILPFPASAFDCIISLNTLHNLARSQVVTAIKEIQRVCSTNKIFITVDSYLNPSQKEIFESWVLTAEYHDYPEGWLSLFKEAGYTGDWDWTIIE